MADINTDVKDAGADVNVKLAGGDKDLNNNITIPTTVEELNALLQKEGDKRVATAIKTREAKLKADFEAKIETEKAEATRLAKLSAAEREKEIFESEKKKFESERMEFAKAQLLNQTMLELQKENLPISFAEYLVNNNAEETLKNINAFKATWQEAMQKAIDEKLKGKTPGSSSNGNNSVTVEDFNKMGYKDRITLLNTNPELYAQLIKK